MVRVMDKESMIIIYYLYIIIIYIIIYQYIIKYINNNIFNRSFLFSLHLSPKVGYRKKTVICGLWTFLSHRELRFIHLSTPQRHPFHKNRMPPFLQNVHSCPQITVFRGGGIKRQNASKTLFHHEFPGRAIAHSNDVLAALQHRQHLTYL